MKKLLIMASIFPPQKNGGGPAVSTGNLASLMKDRFEISVLSQNHEIGNPERLPGVVPGEWNRRGFGRVFYLDWGKHGVGQVLEKIREVKPDIIYQNSFFSYDQTLAVLRYKKHFDKNVRVIIAPRGELGPEKLKCGSVKKYGYITVLRALGYLRGVCWQGTSKEEADDIRALFPKYEVCLVPNIPCSYSSPDYSIEKKPGELRLFYIARIQAIKNLLSGIKYLAGVTARVTYDIYGPMEDSGYWQACEKEIAALPENITVSYKGFLEHDRVPEIVREHHALYLPTKGENFGQTIVDSMLCGRPVIISDMTPWRELSENKAGCDCPLEDGAAFTAAVQRLADMDSADFGDFARGAFDYINSKLDIEKTAEMCAAMFDPEGAAQDEKMAAAKLS